MRVVYLYFMTEQPQRVRAVAPAHAAYWRDHGPVGYLGGPFADRSGGLIIFEARDWEQAEHLVAGDPFTHHGLVVSRWVKEWTPE